MGENADNMNELSLQERAYRLIQQEIVTGALRPGSRISEPELAARLGISRTPVRDAVTQLQFQGLIDRIPRYGTFVRKMGDNDIVELYELREALESYAAALAARRISPEDLKRLEGLCEETHAIARKLHDSPGEILEGSPLRRFLAVETGFHSLIVQSARNHRIAKVIADSHVLVGIFGAWRCEHDIHAVAMAYKQHKSILDALQRGDPAAAAAATASHITTSKELTLAGRQRAAESAADKPENVIASMMPRDLVEELDRIEHSLADRVPDDQPG